MNLSVIRKKFSQYPILFVCGIITPLALALLVMRGSKVTQYEAELGELEREWGNVLTNAERATGLEEDIAKLDAALKEINERLMNADNVAANYEFFYGLESQTGVTLQQFSQGNASFGENLPIGKKDRMRHFSVIPYDVTMTGTLEQLLDFIDVLDRQEYIVRIDSLNISRSATLDRERNSANLLNGRLSCHVLAEKHE